MEKKFKLGVIGAGFMASSIINGALKSGTVNKQEVIMSDISEEYLSKAKSMGVNITTDNLFLANNCEYVLFAVKPQNCNDVLSSIKNTTCKKFITIMAGIKINKIISVIKGAKVARCMPNTPCSIGCGAVGIDATMFSDKKDLDFISSLFSSIAQVIFVDESKLNAVTGISGSAPAYFYLFIKCLIDAGVKNGLSVKDAKTLATATMVGSGKMIQQNEEKSLEDLINAVCSKGGTTIEAVKVFNDKKLNQIVEQAVDACVKRSTELENC